ncbi:MAG TPA: bifunctional diaminohydroxyphosphoribosylaminopyrimidine deaminase/5-amino-6-(5-phosphoribosylamino)uracil reductase RibD [Spirochaetes bacterium]|nr:bifunctional diaminohydroxyphosphoribosylaminopyrimidine deaminase/5-amino-6-(5-phosphoribosylamino)uracil reductase RibD [Spirochaetota bacterium]
MNQSEYNIQYMKKALSLARGVKGNTSPNPAVGAVILKDDHVIAQGATQKAGQDHAEVVALKKAGDLSAESVLYVTLEPCCFFGRTPPCTDLIIQKKVKKVFIGTLDPNPKVNGQGVAKLREAGIEVEYGFLEKEINQVNEDFIHFIKTNQPYCIAKYAMTLDGKIATRTGDSQWISNEKSREKVQHLRNQVDGIMVGVNTVIQDNPRLTVRLNDKHKDPVRIVMDSNGRTPLNSNVLQDKYDTILLMKKVPQSPAKQRDELIEICQEKGKKILTEDSDTPKISLSNAFKQLVNENITSILLEGGGELLSSALKEKVINKVICFIGSKVVLGSDGIFPFGGSGFEKMGDAYQVSYVTAEVLDNDVMITGYINYDC